MAAIRPVVKITQQFAVQSFAAAVPDQNCLIVGPCYHLMDYATDKADLVNGTAYGSLTAKSIADGNPYERPAADLTAITFATPPENKAGALLDEASVVIYFDEILVQVAGDDDGKLDDATRTYLTTSTNVTASVAIGDRIVITSGDNTPVTVLRTVRGCTYDASTTTSTIVVDYLPAVSTDAIRDIAGATYSSFQAETGHLAKWRVEHALPTQAIDADYVDISGQQTVVNGGVQIGGKYVNYAKVYMQYKSLRQDLTQLDTVSSPAEIVTKLGKVDARNPLAVGVTAARANTRSPVQFYAVTSDDITGHTAVRDAIASRKDVYAIVPCTASTPIIKLWRDDCVALEEASRSNFRIVLGAGTLVTTKNTSPASVHGTTETKLSTGLTMFVDEEASFLNDGIIEGQYLVIAGGTDQDDVDGTYMIRRVMTDHVLEIKSSVFPAAYEGEVASYTINGGSPVADHTVMTRPFMSVLRDNTASFITSGVQVGDAIEIPAANLLFDAPDQPVTSHIVAAVLSENTLLVDVEADKELPTSSDGHDGAAAGDIYQVTRIHTRDQIVDDLNEVTDSLLHKRCFMIWPNACRVTGVSNALLTALEQEDLPGYYVSCAVGGMVAGNAPHQGFTGLGIGGIDSVTHSSNYFSDAQIDRLSSGGWYVVLQDNPSAVPYGVHSLSTDTGTLESGELMVVKNFDFVATYFKDLMKQFLKGYNVLPETLGLISSAFNSGASQLIARKSQKIGSPLLSAAIQSIAVTPGAADGIEMFCTVNLPRPLNQIGLYLTA